MAQATPDLTAAEQAARRRGITIGTEVCGNLGRPGTDFTGSVVEIYSAVMQGFEVPAVKVETADGSVRYLLLGSVTPAPSLAGKVARALASQPRPRANLRMPLPSAARHLVG